MPCLQTSLTRCGSAVFACPVPFRPRLAAASCPHSHPHSDMSAIALEKKDTRHPAHELALKCLLAGEFVLCTLRQQDELELVELRIRAGSPVDLPLHSAVRAVLDADH